MRKDETAQDEKRRTPVTRRDTLGLVASEFERLARTCPHCGARSVTLGTRCQACNKPFEPLGVADRIPGLGLDDLPGAFGLVFGVCLLLVGGALLITKVLVG